MKNNHAFEKLLPLADMVFGVLRSLKTKVAHLKHALQPSEIMHRYVRPLTLALSVRHTHGARQVDYEIDELIVLCVVRNGELYIKSFIEHHFTLGVKQIVFLDNDSTDSTIAIAREYQNVTILKTKCPYRKYETFMKKYLVKRFSRNRWNLFADIDELFDYPFSDKLSLKLLLQYLNQYEYTAVLTQMLDMFSDQPLSFEGKKDSPLQEAYPYYDISTLRKEPYPIGYGVTQENIYWHIGGIRKTLFGTDNYITKASLVRFDNKIELFVNCHQVKQASIADLTCVLLHYPFTNLFYEKVMDAVKTDRYAMSASGEYSLYWERLQKDEAFSMKLDTAQQLTNVNDLVAENFLVVSEAYRQWVNLHQKNDQLNYSSCKA